MKRFVPLLFATALLASCAPGLTGPVAGRIVNSKTGEEGTVSFVRDTLRPRLGDPYAADNATLHIGGQTYTGRTVMIDSSAAPDSGGGLRLGLGFETRRGSLNSFGWDSFGGLDNTDRVVRTGNLIARTAGPNPHTLTCTLTANTYEHGVGDCLGSDGTRYALQF